MKGWRTLRVFLAGIVGLGVSSLAADESAPAFVYLKLPESLQPIARGEKYEDPIAALLSAENLGEVTGGGSSLSHPHADGSRTIEYCGVDLELTDLSRGLALLRSQLPKLGIVAGTRLQYTVGGAKLQDQYDGRSWRIGEPRTELHPGFGV